MKQHLDLKTLKLCHLEKVKQFSKHFCPIFFSNWNSSKPIFSHEMVLSQTTSIFRGTTLLGESPYQPKGLVLPFCHWLAPLAGSLRYTFGPWQVTQTPVQKIKSSEDRHQVRVRTSTRLITYLPRQCYICAFCNSVSSPKNQLPSKAVRTGLSFTLRCS